MTTVRTRLAALAAAGALIYRNVTSHACTVYGYPGLDAISSTGHVLATPPARCRATATTATSPP